MTSLIPSYADAYWIGEPVGYSSQIIYGSARCGLVATPVTDPAYQTWLGIGYSPWPWPKDATGVETAAALDFGLTINGYPPTGLAVPSQAQLIAYANSKLTTLRAVARTYDLGGSPDVSVKCDALPETGTDLISLMTWGAANPAATQPWVDDLGAVTTITGANAVTLANAVLVYGKSLYDVLASACAGVAASTITTTVEIDALSWPT